MATCINESDLLLESSTNQTLSEDAKFEDTVNRVINGIALPSVCMFGIVGNILNLTILTRRKLQKSFRSLEQAANLCLIALAVSDLMFCVLAFLTTFLPPDDVYYGKGFWYFYKMYSTAFINLFIMESTMLTVAMSLERYMAICFPLRQDLYLTTRRIKCIIVGSFIFSMAFNVPVLWRFESHPICPESVSNNLVSQESSTETIEYNLPSETLVSAHFKEDEINPKSSLRSSKSPKSQTTFTTLPLSSSLSQPQSPSELSKQMSSSLSSSSISSRDNSNSISILSSKSLPSSSTSSPPPRFSSTSTNEKYKVNGVPLGGSNLYDVTYRACWAIVGNFIPLALLFFFNVCLCRNIYLSYKLRRQFKRQNQAKSSSHILTVTLVVIVVMFFILVAPSEILLLTGTSGIIETIFNFLQSLNFSLNFILYCIISRHFRKTLKYLCLCGCYNIYQVSRDWKKEFETSLM